MQPAEERNLELEAAAAAAVVLVAVAEADAPATGRRCCCFVVVGCFGAVPVTFLEAHPCSTPGSSCVTIQSFQNVHVFYCNVHLV